MADATYRYAPSYGVERFKDNGGLGGAEVTNDNLLITLWSVDAKIPFDPGSLIVPSYADPNVPANEQPAYEQAAKSRDSARFLAQSFSFFETGFILAVLNPAQEYKQKLADAVSYNGGPVGSIASYTIKKSLQVSYLWEVYAIVSPPGFGGNAYPDIGIPPTVFSTYLDLAFPPPGPSAAPIPFLKTNGADGVAPVFFDRSTSDGVKEMIAAVNRGDFYVAMFIEPDGDAYVSIKYPHSVARG